MTLQVTYDSGRAIAGGSGGGIVTEETDKVLFDDQGRVKFRAGGTIRRLDPMHVIEINETGNAGGWF